VGLSAAEFLSPRELASEWRLDVHVVLAWIKSGELRAANLAGSLSGKRPRYRIRREDAEDFWRARQVIPVSKPTTKKKERVLAGVMEGLGVRSTVELQQRLGVKS
jgi:hypothetical protein